MRLLWKRRKFLNRALLVGLIALAAGEAGLRGLHHWMLEGYRLNRAFVSPDAFKILFVGDSFTAGGSTESGKGFPEYMGEALRDAVVGDRKGVEVVNIALSGTDTAIHARRLRLYLERHLVLPDLVFVVTGHNSFGSNEARAAFQREHAAASLFGPWSRVVRYSMVLTVVHELVKHYLGWLPSDEAAAVQSDAFRTYVAGLLREDLVRMVEDAGRRGIPLCLGTYIRPAWSDRVILPVLREVAASHDVPLLDIYSEELDRRFLEDGLYARDGWHPNDAGQRVLAGIFIEKLREEGVMEASIPDSEGQGAS